MPIENEVKDIWNTNAVFWDANMGEGNDFHKLLIESTQLNLLDIMENWPISRNLTGQSHGI